MSAIRGNDLSRIAVLDPAIVEVLRRKSPAERLSMVFDLQRTTQLLLEAYLKWRHPDWNQRQIAGEIARRRSRGSG